MEIVLRFRVALGSRSSLSSMVNFPYRRRKLQNLVSGLEPMHVIILGLLIATVGVGWYY
jgi:hypothetical protein